MDISPVMTVSEKPDWMQSGALSRVMSLLNANGLSALLVGGCVRNTLYQKDVSDIDIACIFPPEQTQRILNDAGVKTIPTGIDHGTITAVVDDMHFEITTLRTDIQTDGRHATIKPTDSWIDDANRRDFTINALYMDMDGHIYDPTGQGIDDIQRRYVRFIGDANQRITEDYLRILRFFRFYADYHDDDMDGDAFAACVHHRAGVQSLSIERIHDEMVKILSSNNCVRAISAMAKGDIIPCRCDGLDDIVIKQIMHNVPDVMTRWVVACVPDTYILRNQDKKFIKSLRAFINDKQAHQSICRALYIYGRDVAVQGMIVTHQPDEIITNTMTSPIPVLPITATDIMDHFNIPQGKMVGQLLKQATDIWLDSECIIPADEIIQKLKT